MLARNVSQSRSMSLCGRRLGSLVGVAVSFSAAIVVPAPRLAFEQQLEDAKSLYRQGSFQEAISKLLGVVDELKPLRDVELRKPQLADAYLHLGLSYVAVGERAAGKEALKALLRLDRERRLDPEIYAPKVVALFEEARAEVWAEPAPVKTASAPTPREGRGLKALPFVLGAGAIGGVALAVGGGGSPAPGPAATAPSPSPTPAPTLFSAPTDVAFIDSSPGPGSSLSVTRGGVILTARLAVVSVAGGTYRITVYLVHDGAPVGLPCLLNAAPIGDDLVLRVLAPREPKTFEHLMVLSVLGVAGACPPLPADAVGFRVLLRSFPENTLVLDKRLAVSYRLVP